MAKKGMIQREIKRQQLFIKYKDERLKIKRIIKNKITNSFIEQLVIQEKLQKLPRNSSKCRLRNRCNITGRSRGFYRDFGLSRHVLREMSHNCFLPGIKKASW